MKKTKLLLAIGALFCSVLLYAAPASNASANAENNKVSLADWKGEWNNMGGYLERPEVQSAYKELAKKENVDVAKG